MEFDVRKPGKKIRDICQALGTDYSLKVFDLENVIYRDLGNGYDFEVSNLDNHKQSIDARIYIWDNRRNQIVEKICDIHSVEELKAALEHSAEKYQSCD